MIRSIKLHNILDYGVQHRHCPQRQIRSELIRHPLFVSVGGIRSHCVETKDTVRHS